jgi:hypothetical protein
MITSKLESRITESNADDLFGVTRQATKSTSSLPGSPFHARRPSIPTSHCHYPASAQRSPSSLYRWPVHKRVLLQSYSEAAVHLPFADDSGAASPLSDEQGLAIPVVSALHSRHSSYTSHLSRISYNSHADLPNPMVQPAPAPASFAVSRAAKSASKQEQQLRTRLHHLYNDVSARLLNP